MNDLLAQRRRNPTREVLTETGLYHSFRLPDGRLLEGATPIEILQDRLASFRLAQDLSGKRVLDIGPWDGYFTFEMERRGAEVTAIDYVDLDTFRRLQLVFESRASYLQQDIYELNPSQTGTFDVVLFLGVLYHLKHPLLALEKVCAVTRDICIIDTFVVDGEAMQQQLPPALPYIEFYERDELGGQLDNWSGPTVSAVQALARAAGFAQAHVLALTNTTVRVAAYRKWQDLPPESTGAIELVGLNCHLHRGRSFQSWKEQYIAFWCAWNEPVAPAVELVYPEIDEFGVAPLGVALTGHGLIINVRIPPGLSPGRHSARVKVGCSAWSTPQDFFIDLPITENELTITALQDGVSWRPDEVDWAHGGWLTLWVAGLTPEGDAGNTIVEIGGVPHYPEAVNFDRGQVNVRLRSLIAQGRQEVLVFHRGSRSHVRLVEVKGNAPPVRGLEKLYKSDKPSASSLDMGEAN